MNRKYHVAGEGYEAGEPLVCWSILNEMGVAVEWKWEDAPEGFDGDVVCLFDTEDEAREFAATYGGTVLAIDIPDDIDGLVSRLPWGGYISPKLTKVEEGFVAIRDGIPAEWISEA